MQGYRYAFKAPITSTGFVRANCRKAAKADESWREIFRKTALSLEQYNLCRQCFMGGVCIASFKHSNKTIRSDKLKHKDFTSSYPARQELDYFPEGAPNWYGDVDSIEELEHLCSTYCCVFVLTLNNVHIKKGVTAPCIPSSKCIHKENYLKLNGKIVSASTLTIVVCELDYKWIKRQYTYDENEIYTISFDITNLVSYSELYLYDTENEIYIDILNEESYQFYGSKTPNNSRFIITSTRNDAPQSGDVTTEVENFTSLDDIFTENKPIYLYTITGQLIDIYNTLQQLPTQEGIYIIKSGDKTLKLIIKK
jgi:hypothetical protein